MSSIASGVEPTRINFLSDSSGHGIVIEIRTVRADRVLAHLPIPLSDEEALIAEIRRAFGVTRGSAVLFSDVSSGAK